MIKEQNDEILRITQEECAEVIQAISKVFRFGIDGVHNGVTNQSHLEEEIGDLVCMVDLLLERGIVNIDNVDNAARAKLIKLSKWANIGETNEQLG
jgi:NTP pyrophosphatase (non-canonical NTP hydrolase)